MLGRRPASDLCVSLLLICSHPRDKAANQTDGASEITKLTVSLAKAKMNQIGHRQVSHQGENAFNLDKMVIFRQCSDDSLD